MTNTLNRFLVAIVLLAVIGLFSLTLQAPRGAQGSVTVGNSYLSTTTPSVADMTNLCPTPGGLASTTTGTLGSVNVLEAGVGTLTIYDATTTDVNLRAATYSTSSIRLADFPTAPTEASYHFDIEFKRGLLVDYTTTGTGVSSTTISYRCGS